MCDNNQNQGSEWLTIIGETIKIIVLNNAIALLASVFLGKLIWKLLEIPVKNDPRQGYQIIYTGYTSICIFQFVYIVPLMLFWSKKRQFAKLKGTIVGAVITAFLSGSCFLPIINNL